MEIEEIRTVWSELSVRLEKQKKLTNEIILKMTQQSYSGKFESITIYESIGAVVCLLTACFLLISFYKLDTWYLIICGIITLAFLLIMPFLVLRSLYQIKNLNITESSYSQTIVRFERVKRRLLLQQKIAVYGSFLIFFTTLAIFSKIFSGKDIFLTRQDSWLYVFAIAVAVVLVFFSRWGYSCYKQITCSAESIIKELE